MSKFLKYLQSHRADPLLAGAVEPVDPGDPGRLGVLRALEVVRVHQHEPQVDVCAEFAFAVTAWESFRPFFRNLMRKFGKNLGKILR